MKRTRHPQERRRQVIDDVVVFRDLPPKLPGEHRWVAVGMYTLTAGQARAAKDAGCPPLERPALVAVTVSCNDCSVELDGDDAGARCPTDVEEDD